MGWGVVRFSTGLLKCDRREDEWEDQPSCHDAAEGGFEPTGSLVEGGQPVPRQCVRQHGSPSLWFGVGPWVVAEVQYMLRETRSAILPRLVWRSTWCRRPILRFAPESLGGVATGTITINDGTEIYYPVRLPLSRSLGRLPAARTTHCGTPIFGCEQRMRRPCARSYSDKRTRSGTMTWEAFAGFIYVSRRGRVAGGENLLRALSATKARW